MPNLGLVVEGQADFHAVPILLRAAGASTGQRFIYRGQGVQSSLATLVQKKLLPATRAVMIRGQVSKVLVIVDREYRSDCPGEFAGRVEAELLNQLRESGYDGNPPVAVVCADRCLENWLISDPEGIGQHAYMQRRISRRVGNNADGKDAVAIIDWAYGTRRNYQKTKDAPALALKVRVNRADVQRRSRSLRKLLREAGVSARR